MDHAFGDPATAVGDDGGAAGLGFNGRDSEIFLGGEDERAGELILRQAVGSSVADDADVGAGCGFFPSQGLRRR